MSSVNEAKQYIKNIEKQLLNSNTKKTIIVDCDPGIDDALALLLLAENLDKVDLKLISSCAGNTPIDITTKNIQFFAENFFNGVRIAKGSKQPLVKKNKTDASDVHGLSGLGDYVIGEQHYPCELNAVESMKDVILNSKEKVTILALGPLTNIAKLFIQYPETKENVEKIYSMIGSINGDGNITSYAEFNAYFDPESFDIVSKCDVPMVINPMELGNETRIKKEVFAKMPTETIKDNFVKVLAESINETVDPTCICLYDLNTVLALCHPEFYEFIPCDIKVFVNPEIGGKTILEQNKNGIHAYQKVVDEDKLNKYILKTLFKN